MAEETVKVFGVDIPKYIDCPQCNAVKVCKFEQFTHNTPCSDCKNKPEYQDKMKQSDGWGEKGSGYGRNEVAGVFTGHGRNFYTNRNGDIIKDEPYKPLEAGK